MLPQQSPNLQQQMYSFFNYGGDANSSSNQHLTPPTPQQQ